LDSKGLIARVKQAKGFRFDWEVGAVLGLSRQDFSNRKSKGTLRPLIIEWAAKEGINVQWILTGEGEMRPAERRPAAYTAEEDIRSGLLKVLDVPFCFTVGPQKLKSWEVRLLIAFRGLTKEQQEDKLFEIESLAERNESRREDGGGSNSVRKNSA
jgi:hypothetical protein